MQGDTFQILGTFESEGANFAAEMTEGEAISVILYFTNLATGEEYAFEIEATTEQLRTGGLYEQVLMVWGRAVNYPSLRFDKGVAKDNASYVLATYKGLENYVAELGEQDAQENGRQFDA